MSIKLLSLVVAAISGIVVPFIIIKIQQKHKNKNDKRDIKVKIYNLGVNLGSMLWGSIHIKSDEDKKMLEAIERSVDILLSDLNIDKNNISKFIELLNKFKNEYNIENKILELDKYRKEIIRNINEIKLILEAKYGHSFIPYFTLGYSIATALNTCHLYNMVRTKISAAKQLDEILKDILSMMKRIDLDDRNINKEIEEILRKIEKNEKIDCTIFTKVGAQIDALI